jgi:hypothetical protein
MALLRDFELPGTGYVVPNAYHVIVNVTTEKRLNDIMPPPDESQPSGYTPRDDDDESQWIGWKSGYIGKITIEIYDSKESRDSGKKPLGALGFSPTSVTTDCQVANPGKDFKIEFFIDTNIQDSVLIQAYNHLKTTEYYKDAIEV